ncbi:c3ec82ce-3eb4-43e9-9391-54db98742801 [Thermothielavioides terrestris]|nr:c3ec82ce-3eb4-43e9-9391-54db98742801 [Thermothielavioides terrestris]
MNMHKNQNQNPTTLTNLDLYNTPSTSSSISLSSSVSSPASASASGIPGSTTTPAALFPWRRATSLPSFNPAHRASVSDSVLARKGSPACGARRCPDEAACGSGGGGSGGSGAGSIPRESVLAGVGGQFKG